MRSPRRPALRRAMRSCIEATIEHLETRRLMAATVSGSVVKAVGNEASPTSAGQAIFRLTRTGETSQPLAVKYAARNASTAVGNGGDYAALAGTATIPAGQSSVNVGITPVDDALVEDNELIALAITPGTGYTIDQAKKFLNVFIKDNDTGQPSVTLTLNKAVAREAGATDPANKGRFTITRSGPTTAAMTVNYTLAGNATNGVDYVTLPGSVMIPTGQKSVVVEMQAIDDTAVEPIEVATVTLAAGTGYTVDTSKHKGTIYFASDDTAPTGWWNTNWEYRVPLTFNAGSHTRTDKPFVSPVDFASAISQAGGSGSLIANSIRVVETSANGQTVVAENVPFQYDASVGEIVVLATGTTAAGAQRHYHVYFDTAGSFSPQAVTPLVTTTDNVTDEGFATIRIENGTATYFYKKASGGISSIVDKAGQDWLNFNGAPGSGSAGEFRGVPNAVFPGGGFHPNFNNGSTQIAATGPLRTVLRTESMIDRGDGEGPEAWGAEWQFFPTYATCTLTPPDNAETYWFLYEGTPGGSMGGNDYSMRPDGTEAALATSWEDAGGLGGGADGEWVYFGDKTVNRYLWLAHHEGDNIVDSHRVMEGNMTVFGFGRNINAGGDSSFMTGQNTFTIGLANGGEYNAAKTLINGAYRDASSTTGSAQKL